MGFGGSVQAMIITLKNNKRIRKTMYDNKHQPESSGLGKIENDVKMTPLELKKFREELKIKRRQHEQKVWIIFGLTMAVILVIVSYFLFFYP